MNREQAEHYIKAGNRFYELQHYQEAIEQFKQATTVDSSFADGYNNWGLALAELKRYEEAIEQYKQATTVDPDYTLGYYNWGLALADLKRYEEAIEQYKQATTVDPSFAYGYNSWGLALAELKRYEEAIEQFKQATTVDPDYTLGYYNWGLALAELKRYEEAIEQFKQATTVDPNYIYASANIAYALSLQGKYRLARVELEQIHSRYKLIIHQAKKDKNIIYFRLLGNILHEIFGDLDGAEKIYIEGLKLDASYSEILVNLVELYLEQRDEDVHQRTVYYWKAREAYKKAEQNLKANLARQETAYDYFRLGELLIKMKEYTEAQKYFEIVIQKDPEMAESYANLGAICVWNDDFKKGGEYFEKALMRNPDDFAVWANLAEAYFKLNQIEQAETEYKKILAIVPEHIESHIGLGEVYTSMGDDGEADMYEQAVRHFNEALKLAKSGCGSKRLRKKEKAAVLYSRGYAKVKLYESSQTIKDEHLLNKALEDFRSSSKIDPDHHKARLAAEKINKKLVHFSPERIVEKIGPILIFSASLIVFCFTQYIFFQSKLNQVNQLIVGSANQQTGQAPLPSQFQQSSPSSSQPDPASSPIPSYSPSPYSNSPTSQLNPVVSSSSSNQQKQNTNQEEPISAGYYALLTFGSLAFMVVGLYLPQVLKLKVPGVELEKSSVEQISTSTRLPLGIKK